MTPAEREEIRRHIEREISTLERSIDTLTELTESENQSDANDWFTSKESNPSKEINELALVKARQRIMVLTNLLKGIDSPDFGICIKCNRPIATDRLKAVPTARRCIACS